MNRQFVTMLVSALLVGAPVPGHCAAWVNKNVSQIQSTYTGSDCFYFTLEGVTEADPVVPGAIWFAIPRTQNGSKDAYAMLLAAKLSGAPLRVHTNGTVSCGYATASEVFML
jgi:hypothetical protein